MSITPEKIALSRRAGRVMSSVTFLSKTDSVRNRFREDVILSQSFAKLRPETRALIYLCESSSSLQQ